MIRNFQSSTPPIPPYPSVPSGAPHTAPLYTSPYLPTGAPPWPTTILQRQPQPVAIPLTATQTGTINERKPLSARSMLIGAGLLALAILVGVGLTLGGLFVSGQLGANAPQAQKSLPSLQPTTASSTNSATPGSTSTSNSLPTPTSFSTMSSDNQKAVGVLVKYPSDWVEVPPPAQPPTDGSGIAVFRSQQTLGIIVAIWKVPASEATTTDALNTNIINAIYSGNGNTGNTNLQAMQPTNQHPTFAGTQWDEQDASFSDSSGIPRNVVSIAIKHGTMFYVFSFESPQMYLNDAKTKYIQPMLDSFKFLS